MKRVRRGTKLLVASLGVAAVVYGCTKNGPTAEPVGNLVAPEPEEQADAASAEPPPPEQPPEPVGNLMPPPPEPPTDPDGS